MPSKKKAAKDVTPAALESAPPPAPKKAVKKATAPAAPASAPAAPAKTQPIAKSAKASKSAEPAPPEVAARPTKPPAAKPAVAKSSAAKPSAAKPAAAKPVEALKPPAKPSVPPKAAASKPAKATTTAPATPEAARPASAAKKAAPPKASGSTAALAPTPSAGKPPASKPPVSKAPVRARLASVGGLDDPDDDDLEDEDDAAPRPAAIDDDEVAMPTALADEAPPPPKRLTPRVVPPMPPRKPGVITLALSPDADDAFMLYALEHGKIETETRRYELVRGDIAALNDEANKGTYDVTAFSFGAWPQIVERYLALPCGASFGDGVGPVVVSKTLVRPNEVEGMLVGVPGLSTTAALVLRLWLSPHRLRLVPVPFAEVVEAVKSGKVRAGVLIHEAQLTYRLDGLAKVMDLGRWWTDKTEGLPLPLGGTAIRRDIPVEERTKIALDLKRSIAYAMGHREEALEHAAKFSKGLPRQLLDRYITMYVNELTLDIGERGRQAVHTLFDYAVRLGTMRERIDLELA